MSGLTRQEEQLVLKLMDVIFEMDPPPEVTAAVYTIMDFIARSKDRRDREELAIRALEAAALDGAEA